MFSRDHLIIGAVGFVLGGVVATASITAVLLTQAHEEKTCPPVTAIIAPAPQTMNLGQATTPPPPPTRRAARAGPGAGPRCRRPGSHRRC